MLAEARMILRTWPHRAYIQWDSCRPDSCANATSIWEFPVLSLHTCILRAATGVSAMGADCMLLRRACA